MTCLITAESNWNASPHKYTLTIYHFSFIVTFINTWYNSTDNENRMRYTSSTVWTNNTESNAAQDWGSFERQKGNSASRLWEWSASVHPLPHSVFIVEFGSKRIKPVVALHGFIFTTEKTPGNLPASTTTWKKPPNRAPTDKFHMTVLAVYARDREERGEILGSSTMCVADSCKQRLGTIIALLRELAPRQNWIHFGVQMP